MVACHILRYGGIQLRHYATETAVERRGLVVGEAEVDVPQRTLIAHREYYACIVEVEGRVRLCAADTLTGAFRLLGIEVEGEAYVIVSVNADAAGIVTQAGHIAA